MQKSRNDSEIHKKCFHRNVSDTCGQPAVFIQMVRNDAAACQTEEPGQILSEIEKDDISGKTQQQKMNRVEPVEEVFHFQIAFFSVVEKDGHEGQGSCELILHDEGSGQTLDRTGIADKKQSTDKENASCTVVGLKEPSEINADGHDEKLQPVISETIHQYHHQHTEKQSKEHILFVRIKPVIVDRIVKGISGISTKIPSRSRYFILLWVWIKPSTRRKQ